MHAPPLSDRAPPPLTLFQGDRDRACQLYESLLKEEQAKEEEEFLYRLNPHGVKM